MATQLEESISVLNDLAEKIKEKISKIKEEVSKDVLIDEVAIDASVLEIPKLYAKYMDLFQTENQTLQEFQRLREKVKLERWKYYQGKQTDKYCKENGLLHETIQKSDVDRYLAADAKIQAMDNVYLLQKGLVGMIEEAAKEVRNKNFYAKIAVEWRKFVACAP